MHNIQPRKRPTLTCGESRTKQAMKQESDVNFIMQKYQKTGLVNFVATHQAQYMECPDVDFQTAMDTIRKAEEMFMDMPAKLRQKFDHNPGKFLDFIQNPENRE